MIASAAGERPTQPPPRTMCDACDRQALLTAVQVDLGADGRLVFCGPCLPDHLALGAQPFVHTRDEDCVLGEDGTCVLCGTSHVETCSACGGHGFHRIGCAESES